MSSIRKTSSNVIALKAVKLHDDFNQQLCVPCPHCKVGIGEKCVEGTVDGNLYLECNQVVHFSRRAALMAFIQSCQFTT